MYLLLLAVYNLTQKYFFKLEFNLPLISCFIFFINKKVRNNMLRSDKKKKIISHYIPVYVRSLAPSSVSNSIRNQNKYLYCNLILHATATTLILSFQIQTEREKESKKNIEQSKYQNLAFKCLYVPNIANCSNNTTRRNKKEFLLQYKHK